MRVIFGRPQLAPSQRCRPPGARSQGRLQATMFTAATGSQVHPDAVKRRRDAEERQERRNASRKRAQQLAKEGKKWWQEPCEHMQLLQSPAAFLEAVEGAQAAGKLLIVKYFSEECYACKSLTPKLHKMAEGYRGDVVFVKINGSLPEFATFVQDMGIQGVPWFQFYRDGELVHSMSASLNPQRLAAFKQEIVRQKQIKTAGA